MKNAEYKSFSISEFANACGTTKDTLYHYEKQGILVPAFDESNHYRHYSSSDFHLFQYIAHLRRMGFSVSDIRDCLEERNVRKYLEMLKKSQQSCLDQIAELKHTCGIITEALDAANHYSQIPVNIPGVIYRPEEYFYASVFTGRLNSLEGIRQIQAQLAVAGTMPDITSNLTVFKITGQSVKAGVSPKLSIMTQSSQEGAIDKEHLHVKPAGSYLQIFLRTDVITSTEDQLLEYAGTMMQYAEEHNYHPATDFYCFLHISSFLTDNPQEFLTEFQLGIG